jgi:hypothetical protein
MAHYEDLTLCDYFGTMLPVNKMLAVGWLEPGHPYPTGDPGRDVYDRLQEFGWHRAWQPTMFCGGHSCRLGSCRYGSFYSHKNIFIPGNGVVYVAPEGIVHYISCHDYMPPPEFCAAVLACPSEDSPEYFAALRVSGFQVDTENPAWIRRNEVMSVVEARGRAIVAAVESFRVLHGHWPQSLDEAVGLADDAGTWHYAAGAREFKLYTDWRAREAFALRYKSELGSWEVATGSEDPWFLQNEMSEEL